MSAFLVLASLILSTQPTSSPVTIVPQKNPTQVEIVSLLPEDQQPKLPQGKLTQDQGETVLRLALQPNGAKEPGLAMLGTYERRKGVVSFRPRFGLQHGQRYRVFFEPTPGKVSTTDYLVPPRKPTPPAVVEKIFPSGDVLPANHLRFHLYFSKPMRGGQDIFDQIKLLDADGKEVEDPWLRDELWDSEDTHLILYIHPGRIKWGILLRELLGPVLLPDKQYTLVIGPGLLDANGQALGKEVRKKFRTLAEDRVRIELKQWKVQAPPAGSKKPLVLALPKPLDVNSLQTFLTVTDAKGMQVKGRIVVGPAEKTVEFQPEQAWRAGRYQLNVNGRLEDVAGNTPLRPFDVDLNTPKTANQPLQLGFQPR